MRKILKIVFILLVIGFIVLQFFQPEANISEDNSGVITEQVEMPENIKFIFENACLDCHSNHTNYWWYNKVAPASWIVNDHITEGKDELNLSEWRDMDIYDKIGVLDDIGKEVERKTMPLKSYSAIHRKAKLSNEQIEEFVTWAEKYSEDLMNSIED